MAIEVARAYDSDKNLVPLYILTDSDPIYDPVSPGFDTELQKNDKLITVTASSKNPTGGNITVIGASNFYASYKGVSGTWKVINNSSFDIKVILILGNGDDDNVLVGELTDVPSFQTKDVGTYSNSSSSNKYWYVHLSVSVIH